MPLKAVLVYSNDDGFSLGVELLRATVRERTSPADVDHRVWFHEMLGSLTDDYLGHYTPFLAKLASLRPDVIAFSVFVWNHDEFARMSQMVRRHVPSARIVWGGGDVNSRRMAGVLLGRYDWLDYVLRGEGEESYPALLNALAGGDDPAQIPGLSLRDGDEVRHNPGPGEVALPELPMVFTPENLRLDPIYTRYPEATIAYETGRGCRQHCRFCLYALSKLRAFSMERIEQELSYLLDAGIPSLRICDAHLGISRPRAMEIFEIIAAHNRRTLVNVYPDVKHVDKEYVEAMNRAGCRVVSLGIQSSDRTTLQLAGRRFKEDVFAEAAGLIRRHHNHTLAADVIVGMPGDNYAKVKESIRFAYRSGIERVHFAPLMAFPGTDFYEFAEDYELEFFDFAPPLAISSRGFSDEEYRRSIVLAHRVEQLQDAVPTMVRCALAADVDPVELAETVDVGEVSPLASTDLLDWVDTRPPAAAALLRQALAWDRALKRQNESAVTDVPSLADDMVVAEVRREEIEWFETPLHRLVLDHELRADDLETGRFGYLFPPGGLAIYEVVGAVRLACETLRPGLMIGAWRDLIATGTDAGPDEIRQAVRLLCLTGVAKLQN